MLRTEGRVMRSVVIGIAIGIGIGIDIAVVAQTAREQGDIRYHIEDRAMSNEQ